MSVIKTYKTIIHLSNVSIIQRILDVSIKLSLKISNKIQHQKISIEDFNPCLKNKAHQVINPKYSYIV